MKNMQLSQPAPITQIVPVADLYELKIEGGPMTRHTKSSYVASEWIKAGAAYTVQEYVKLERLQEAYTAPPAVPGKIGIQEAKELFNYLMTEEELNATVNGYNACRTEMLSHVGDATDKVEPVMICDTCGHDADHQGNRTYKCDNGHVFHMRRELVSQGYTLNSPETPDGWIACTEQTPDADGAYWCWFGNEEPSVVQQRVCIWINRNNEWCDSAVTHWMPLPAAPTQGEKQ